jgi:hypothetical protein
MGEKRNTMSYELWVSVVNNFVTDSNNYGEYVALTDSAMSQAEAWSSLSY